uniref:Trafficking protein particle complex subunit n=1 Tax=Arcella intermedia TaxID=1963864 RepID=A0A6B2LKJ3_9EUKA
MFTLTYGAIVCQLIKELDSLDEVNNQLDKMGYNIGLRLIDEFLARSNLGRCRDIKETAEVITKVGFKMFFGVTANVANFNPKKQSFLIQLEDNPLIDFVELPPQYKDKLSYSNLLCGVIRGALEMVQMKVVCTIKKCPLKGDEITEIKVKLIEILTTEIPVGDE